VNGGFFNHAFLLRDSFLDPVRNDPTFQRILAQTRAKHEAFEGGFLRRARPVVGSRSPKESSVTDPVTC
jgi:hypothetical protein